MTIMEATDLTIAILVILGCTRYSLSLYQTRPGLYLARACTRYSLYLYLAWPGTLHLAPARHLYLTGVQSGQVQGVCTWAGTGVSLPGVLYLGYRYLIYLGYIWYTRYPRYTRYTRYPKYTWYTRGTIPGVTNSMW